MTSYLRDGLDHNDLQATLRDENLELKRRLNAQMDVTKKLNTRVQKMSEDMAKLKVRAGAPPSSAFDSPTSALPTGGGAGGALSRPHGIPPPTVVAARNIVHKRNPSLEALVDDMRAQLRDLSKENINLKSKVQHFRALHEATLRKRGKWDSIGPKGKRVGSAAAPQQRSPTKQAGMGTMVFDDDEPPTFVQPPPPPPPPVIESPEYLDLKHTLETVRHDAATKDVKLAELLARVDELTRALEVERAKAPAKPDGTEVLVLKQQIAVLESRQRTMTQDAASRSTMIEELLQRCAKLEEAEVRHQQQIADAAAASTQLHAELDTARAHVLDLETELAQARVDAQAMEHLKRAADDARTERQLALDENARLIDQALESQQAARARHEAAVQELHGTIAHVEASNRQLLLDNKRLLDELDVAKSQTAAMTARHAEAAARADTAAHELATLKKRVQVFAETNHVSAGDIQEALVLVAWRRQHGIALDTLLSMHEWVADKAGALHLRREYLAALHDLDHTRQLLALQQEVNRDYRTELAAVQDTLDGLREEYARQRERDARVLDARQHRIAALERQLRNAAMSVSPAAGVAQDPSLGLAMVVRVHSWTFAHSAPASPVILLFVLDFFTFDSVVTPMTPPATAQSLVLDDWSVAWPLDPVTDALFWYLESDAPGCGIAIDVVAVRPDGTFAVLGSARVARLAHLLKAGTPTGLHYTLEVRGDPAGAREWGADPGQIPLDDTDDGRVVLGTIQCSVSLSQPLEEAWLAHQERSRGLPSSSASTALPSAPGATPKYRSDTLLVSLHSPRGLPTKTRTPALYALVDVYHRTGLRTACPSAAADPLAVSLVLAPDAVAWLGNQPMVVSVFDDADPDDTSAFLGQARVSLARMLERDADEVEAEVRVNGKGVGTIVVRLAWRTAAGDGRQEMVAAAQPQPPLTVARSRSLKQLRESQEMQRRQSSLSSEELPPSPSLHSSQRSGSARGGLVGDPSAARLDHQHREPSGLSSYKTTPSHSRSFRGNELEVEEPRALSPHASGSVIGGDAARSVLGSAHSVGRGLGETDDEVRRSVSFSDPPSRRDSSSGGQFKSHGSVGGQPTAVDTLPLSRSNLAESSSLAGTPPADDLLRSRLSLDQSASLANVLPTKDLSMSRSSLAKSGSLAKTPPVDALPRSRSSLRESTSNLVEAEPGPDPEPDSAASAYITSNAVSRSRSLEEEKRSSAADLAPSRATSRPESMADLGLAGDPALAPSSRAQSMLLEATMLRTSRAMLREAGSRDSLGNSLPALAPVDTQLQQSDFDDGGGLGDSSFAAGTDDADGGLVLSPTVTDAHRDAFPRDHVTLVLHTLRLATSSAVVADHLSAARAMLVAFDLWPGASVETSERALYDDSTGELSTVVDIGLVASFPGTAERWHDVLLAAGQPTAFVVAVRGEENEAGADFVDIAAGHMYWEHVVEAVAQDAAAGGDDDEEDPPLVFSVDVDFLDGSGALGTLVVEVHGMRPILAELGMVGDGLQDLAAASFLSLPGVLPGGDDGEL
ncbi:hypothetical protein H9P43_000229 [Blastocladiella emersonii ATCC 22665]|nr:hypothetical protein H9P43_000229 [Blastocladiella emersonii ATCC 22665]